MDYQLNLSWTSIATFIGGIPFGSIITVLHSQLRHRKQPIEYTVSVESVFGHDESSLKLPTKVVVKSGDDAIEYNNISIVFINITNCGNTDYESFEFGATFNESLKVVHAELNGTDRHHKIKTNRPIDPKNAQKQIDFVLTPFNRKDTYNIKIYVFISKSGIHYVEPTISTSKSVKLVNKSQN